MLSIFRFLRGYLTVLFYGEYVERIFNFTAKNRISIWNSRLKKEGIECEILVSGFRKLPEIIKGSGIKVHIIHKKGLPFKIERYKKRIGIVLGLIFFILFIEVMSGFVWSVEIVGNKRVETEKISYALEQIGIKEGIRASSINPKINREKLLLEVEGLAWASINVEGSKIIVNVTETKEKEKDNSTAGNIKADSDGIIERIDVTVGNCLVKVGDTVKKGDVLVSGVMENASETRFVRATGEIFAKTSETLTFEEPFDKTLKTENGNKKEKCVLEIFTVKIPLFLGSEIKPYNSETEIKNLVLLGENLPIRLYKREFRFVDEIRVKNNQERVYEILEKRLDEKLQKEYESGYEITDKQFINEGDRIVLNAVVSSKKDIALYEPLLISNKE
ncbi:MAG: hypothetical protein E7560_02350 [Ruminococcaceae bacterium]|nr:hypothetical protein [Oscillospiraceae bacterium]